MNCWSMSCQSKLTPQEHCCFRAPQGETGCPEPQAETSSLRGHQPQVFAARSHRSGHVPCCPCCTADGAMQVPQGHSSSHASLHHLQHPLLLLSPQNTAGSKGKDPSTQPLLEGQSQPPAQGWRRAEHPSQPTQLPAACGSVMKRGHGPLPAGPGALVSFQPGIFLLDLYFFLIPFFFFFCFCVAPRGTQPWEERGSYQPGDTSSVIHCLAPAGCCSRMGALPATAARCHLRTSIAWPGLAAFPSPYSLAPASLPRRGGAAAQPPALAQPQAWSQELGFPRDGWGPACVRLGRSLPGAILQRLGVPMAGTHLLPVCKQLQGLLLWDGSRALGRKFRTYLASPSTLLASCRSREPWSVRRAGCCAPKYPVLSPIHFYSQSENNLPYNNTGTHSTALGTLPSGHDATAQAGPSSALAEVSPSPGSCAPAPSHGMLHPHPAQSTASHAAGGTCAWCQCVSPSLPSHPGLPMPCCPLAHPAPSHWVPAGTHPPPCPPSAPSAGVGGLYSMAVRSRGRKPW